MKAHSNSEALGGMQRGQRHARGARIAGVDLVAARELGEPSREVVAAALAHRQFALRGQGLDQRGDAGPIEQGVVRARTQPLRAGG